MRRTSVMETSVKEDVKEIRLTIEEFESVLKKWERVPYPLLLILIDVEESKKFYSHKEFMNIQMSVFDKGKRIELRSAKALPWKVPKTRWARELK